VNGGGVITNYELFREQWHGSANERESIDLIGELSTNGKRLIGLDVNERKRVSFKTRPVGTSGERERESGEQIGRTMRVNSKS
jgi:hypothetical protein